MIGGIGRKACKEQKNDSIWRADQRNNELSTPISEAGIKLVDTHDGIVGQARVGQGSRPGPKAQGPVARGPGAPGLRVDLGSGACAGPGPGPAVLGHPGTGPGVQGHRARAQRYDATAQLVWSFSWALGGP